MLNTHITKKEKGNQFELFVKSFLEKEYKEVNHVGAVRSKKVRGGCKSYKCDFICIDNQMNTINIECKTITKSPTVTIKEKQLYVDKVIGFFCKYDKICVFDAVHKQHKYGLNGAYKSFNIFKDAIKTIPGGKNDIYC